MLVTRETDYAVRTVVFLSRTPETKTSVSDIAVAMHIPKSFLAKLLQRLVRHHILLSSRGAQGGFQLARKPSQISLLDIMEAMQGPPGINVCALDRKRCRLSNTCVVHPVWVDIRKEVEKRLKQETIDRLLGSTRGSAKK